MMHGREKSDPAIVAKKPANNAGQPAAERVERRAGTEGNAGQQSTRRAQDRESVSQALERVRQAAKQRRKERFTVRVAPKPSSTPPSLLAPPDFVAGAFWFRSRRGLSPVRSGISRRSPQPA